MHWGCGVGGLIKAFFRPRDLAEAEAADNLERLRGWFVDRNKDRALRRAFGTWFWVRCVERVMRAEEANPPFEPGPAPKRGHHGARPAELVAHDWGMLGAFRGEGVGPCGLPWAEPNPRHISDSREEVAQRKRTRPVTRGSWRAFFGVDRYLGKVQVQRDAASGVAAYLGASTDGEPGLVCQAEDPVSLGNRVGAAVVGAVWGRGVGRAQHAIRHRALNRLNSRIVLVRELVEQVKDGRVFENTNLDRKALTHLASKAVAKAVEEGRIAKAQSYWYTRNVVAFYFVRTEDEILADEIAGAPEVVLA